MNNNLSSLPSISRRSFVVGTGSAAIGVSFGALAPTAATAQAGAFSPVAWVSIAADNTATIYSAAAEMGQGTMTALPMVLAENMELDWNRVKVVQAPPDPKRFGNPKFGGGMLTGASRTVQGYYQPLRLAGLQAKLVMIDAAAKVWGVPADQITAENSLLAHRASNRSMTYGDVAKVAQAPAELPKVDAAMLKPMSQFKLVGKDVPRVDVAAKTNGSAIYGLDVRLPGMQYAAVMAAPVQGEKPEKIDDAAAKAVAGVKAVVPLPSGVAVVADSFFTARKARDLLKVEWSKTAKARSYNSDAAIKEFTARAENLTDAGVTFHSHGDAAKEIAAGARVFKASYTSEHVAQFTLEPMNCTAKVDGDKIELWVPSQTIGFVVGGVAAVGGFKPENIKVNITLLGGGYGRRVEAEYAVEAALIAKAVPGVPVQMIWSREDDMQRSKPRPLTAQHLIAAVDAQGKLVGLQHRVTSEGIYARVLPGPFKAGGNKDAPVMEGSEGVYDIPGHLVQQCLEDRGIACSFWRGVGPGYLKFSIETLLDEVAVATNQDPLQMRLNLTQKSPRAQAVLREAAQMAQWSRARTGGRALGLAFSDTWNSFIAMVAEVSLVQGRPVVHTIWAAVDCGHALTPRNIQTQIEGSAIFGLSAALGEKLSYKAGEAQEKNLGAYNLLRAGQTPEVVVKVMPTDNPPGGIGEAGLPPIAPAVANAIAKLSGKRIRSLPFPQTV
ncbi:MAG: molybdopterin cofactor-binding domain-containing protein [Burkholderiaceae bacterium]